MWGRLFWVGLALVALVHLLPRLILGRDSYVTIHDNLDIEFVLRVLAAQPGRIFSPEAQVPELMGGLPRASYPTGANLSTLAFLLFPPFVAYVVLELLARVAAFVGMFLLLRDHVAAGGSALPRTLVAMGFAFLPFYSLYGLSIAGQPLVAWALLELWRGRSRAAAFVLLALFPFASIFPTAGVFLLAAAGLVYAGAMLAQRRWVPLPAAGLAVLVLGYLISDWQLISGQISHEFISHRSVWRQAGSPYLYDFKTALRHSWANFYWGSYHAASLHRPIAVAAAGVTAWWLLHFKSATRPSFLWLLPAAAMASLSIGFNNWSGLVPAWDLVPVLRGVNVRFSWLLPLIWFSTLGGVVLYAEAVMKQRWLAIGLAALQMGWCFAEVGGWSGLQPERSVNYARLLGSTNEDITETLSYREFFSPELFDEIEAAIGAEPGSYRVGNVGLHPGIAAFNGINVVGGYHQNYPLSRKEDFLRVTGGELSKSKKLNDYVVHWGNRLYLRPSEGQRWSLNTRPPSARRVVKDFDLDLQALRALGAEYLLSAYEIRDPALLSKLELLGSFSGKGSPYTIDVYRLRP